MAHLPSAAKLMDKKLVQTLATNRHMFLQNYAQTCQNETKLLHHQVSYLLMPILKSAKKAPSSGLLMFSWHTRSYEL